MEYKTVFDIAAVGYKSWDFPAFGLIFIVIGIILVANRKYLSSYSNSPLKAGNAFGVLFLLFAVVWTLIAFASTYSEYSSLSKAANSKNVHVVEGVVTEFKPMPYSGRAKEKFCVSNTCFEYSDYIVVGGFNNTASHGGPIKEGLHVRVTYVENSILKLEVAN